MKKEQMELKEVIKAAILEAFAELYGVATTDAVTPEPPGTGDGEASGSGNNTGNTGNNPNNGNSDENSGGGLNNGRPKPNVGVGTFGLN